MPSTAAGEPTTAKRTSTGSRAKPAPASKRAKTGGKKPTGGSDNASSGSATSKPLAPGETTNELVNIHNLQSAATPNREPESPLGPNGKQRSSQYRGVTKHKRSGRWEAHIWVKETGKQMYLGGYEKEEHAAEAYDVAAMKCKGTKGARKVKLNFPASKYSELDSFMQSVGLEELVMAIRRQSQGFARGSSGFRGVTHHPNGRWEARIGMPGSKHIYLGLYNEEGAAARAYDRALVRLRGAAAATNYSLTNYKDELQAFEMDKSTETLACSTGADTDKPHRVCQCLEDFTGPQCALEIERCPGGFFCANGGTCASSSCDCPLGYSGHRCDISDVMDTCTSSALAGQVFPNLLSRKTEDRRNPAHQRFGNVVHGGLG